MRNISVDDVGWIRFSYLQFFWIFSMRYSMAAAVLVSLAGCSSSSTPDGRSIDSHAAAIDSTVAIDSSSNAIDSTVVDSNLHAPDAEPNLCMVTETGPASRTFHCTAVADYLGAQLNETHFDVAITNTAGTSVGGIHIVAPGDIQTSSTIAANATSWTMNFDDFIDGVYSGMGPSDAVGTLSFAVTSQTSTSIHGSSTATMPGSGNNPVTLSITF